MHIAELQKRIARRDYVVDPRAVAEALLRYADPCRDLVVDDEISRSGGGSRRESAGTRPLR